MYDWIQKIYILLFCLLYVCYCMKQKKYLKPHYNLHYNEEQKKDLTAKYTNHCTIAETDD